MKKSFVDCSKCKLNSLQGKVIETNCENDLTNIDEFYITLTKNWNYLLNYLKTKKIKYVIMSPIICNYKEDLEKEEVENISKFCSGNILSVINICKPKKVYSIGSFSILDIKSTYFQNLDEFLKKTGDKKVDDLSSLDFSFLENDKQEVKKEEVKQIWNENIVNPEKDLYKFKIPDKYYTSQYRLVDVQQITNQSRIIYIFRDKNNKKEFYDFPVKENDFYWYESSSYDNKLIEDYKNLQLKIGNHQKRCLDSRGYQADINLTTLHSVDYFLQNQEECQSERKNILFFDCEMYTFKDKIFPDPDKAIYPIVAISFSTDDENDPVHIFLLKLSKEIDSRIDEIIKSNKYSTLTIFTDEATMIDEFLNRIQKIEPDFITGWNSTHFDFPYLINRMKKLQIPANKLSPFGNIYSNTNGKLIMTGYIGLDQLDLFQQDTTRPRQSSYTLDYIGKKITGESKVAYEGNLNTLYNDNIEIFIQYSIKDTSLIKNIEKNVRHIALQDELRIVTTTSHVGASTTLGQAEGLFLTSLKKKGLVARNRPQNVEKESLPGAYVFEAKGGIYNGILCDFDFQSLYPSIINSWNLGPDTYIAKIVNEQDTFNFIYEKDLLKDKKIEIIFDPLQKKETKQISIEELQKFIEENHATVNITGTIFLGHDIKESIFYTVIDILFKGRKSYKKMMLEAKEKKDNRNEIIYDSKQLAYKILANSLYGALGNEYFRMYCNDLAKSITLTGQELLKYITVHLDNFILKRGNVSEFKINSTFMKDVTNLKEVLYGDTDSAFLYLTDYLKDKNIEVKKSPEVLEEIKKIQNFANETIIDEFLKLHNIQKSKSMIYLKNEYLFSKYYSLNGKKHYALKVISQEGKDVQSIEIKGLEMKRSEIPSYSQKLLTEVLDMILSEDNTNLLDKILEKVDKAKKEMVGLIEKRDNSIVRVSSFSKDIEQYKKEPQHIKGMKIWNILNGKEDFRQHSKGYLWPLMGIKLEKAPEYVRKNYSEIFLKKYKSSDLDVICLPEDVKKLPEWFEPNIKEIINYGVQDRVDNLVEPLMKKVEMLLF